MPLVAIASSDVTLISGDLQAIVTIIKLSKATIKNIKQNLFFAYCPETIKKGDCSPFFY